VLYERLKFKPKFAASVSEFVFVSPLASEHLKVICFVLKPAWRKKLCYHAGCVEGRWHARISGVHLGHQKL